MVAVDGRRDEAAGEPELGACASPFTVKRLKAGKHTLCVLAISHGKAGKKAAVVRFAVVAPHRRLHLAG
jgi:hypothetical protein